MAVEPSLAPTLPDDRPSAADDRARRRSRFEAGALAAGLGAGAASLAVYATAGYGRPMVVLWVVGMLALAAGFAAASPSLARPALADVLVPIGLAAAFAPLYLVRTYAWPVQVGSDEVAIMSNARRYAEMSGVDPFGLTDYLGHPALLFVVWGKLGQAFGGVELSTMRPLHATFGLLTIAAAYTLFRQLLPRGWAALAGALLGVNHAFLMLSRMAMRENTAVLTEVVALSLLLYGLRHRHALATFAGGVAAGVGFYVYFPGRVAIVVWLLFLAALAAWWRGRSDRRPLARAAATALAGCTLMAGPVVIANLQAPPDVTAHQRESLLVFRDARAVQRDWVFEDSVASGYVRNVEYGLSAFNNLVQDHAWNYPNSGHGFLDPLTGVLLWLGVGVAGWRLVRRRGDPSALLPLVGFISLWLAFAFLVNKAPNYPRLLVALPFAAYLACEGVRAIAGVAGRRLGARAVAPVAVVALGTIVALNLAIAWDFVATGRRTGDAIGGTGRRIVALRDVPGERFFVAATPEAEYYTFGYPRMYTERIRSFARDESQVGGAVDARSLAAFSQTPPFALFMRSDAWQSARQSLEARYPEATLHKVTPDGRLVVLEAR